jgi:transmembrane protein 33
MSSAGEKGRPQAGQAQALQQRLQGVIQHQQFYWWLGHVVIVISTLLYGLFSFRFSDNTNLILFWYRLSLLGAIGAYGVVVHKMYFRV